MTMSNLHKSQWTVAGNHLNVMVPFAKVDQERRLVSGFATLDNLDNQGDVVLSEASAKAFARARGNLREMHQPIAAGHLVDFQEEEFFHVDPETGLGKTYRGIFVTAYVSKGAESTWEKVLDGTLTGFSIGGEIKEASNDFDKDASKSVRIIKDYDLVELSLVDNPANPLANVFSFQKSAEGSVTLKGMIAETSVENVFYCGNDKIARTADADSAACSLCGNTMENIGWVETGPEKSEKVREVVAKHIDGNSITVDANALTESNIAAKNAEGGKTVTKNDNNQTPQEGEVVAGIDEQQAEQTQPAVADQQTGAPQQEAPAQDENVGGEPDATPQEGEVVAGIDEVPDETTEIQKSIDALRDNFDENLKKARDEYAQTVTSLEEKISELVKSMDTKFSEFDSKLSELDKSLVTAKGAVTEFEKALDTYNSGGAIKKSGEVEKTGPEKIQKDDDWNGAFSVKSLFK